MVVKFKIKGMMCSNCVDHVTRAVQGVAGVRAVQVSLNDSRANVDFDETVAGVQAIVDAIVEEGYEASPMA